MNTIILCGGKIDYVHLPISTNTSNAMVPVNGRPVIGWIIEDLIQKKINEAIIVLRADDHHLYNFLTRVYGNRIKLTLKIINESKSILHSLAEGLSEISGEGVRVILGDTLITDSYDRQEDFIYAQEVDDSERWCLVEQDENQLAVSYIDKSPGVHHLNMAVCGYYHIKHAGSLKMCIQDSIRKGHTQISHLLASYQKVHQVRVVKTSHWLDFGNIDNLIKARRELLQGRYFNSLTIDPILNTITKVSEMDEKLRQELKWYELIPEKLKVLSPRIISKQEVNGKLHLVQEYYGYPTLAELYLFSDLTIENWISILKKLIVLTREFRKFKTELLPEDMRAVYATKTFDRLAALQSQNQEWKQILEAPEISINGQKLKNISQLEPWIKKRIEKLIEKNNVGSVIHGDYCFSNILFDYHGQIIRLIDPRGSFGKPGVYGDPRYDLAKLRHSVVGLYDYIIADLFELSVLSNSDYHLQVFTNEIPSGLQKSFDTFVIGDGYDSTDIMFIEALLFLSMLPLHKEKPLRQKAMYLTGILRLNEIIECE